ncbi:hypothetical protein CEUSTIGMA_g1099.t1 [Chlamydomonas eustigma]|uniref:Uncharacterized protein n=1 Tax=Chlamydomonas eustigma TaxID=1157962 RepID=A0A250WS47_9CHLO|nr:hypothetical protein CEUSTIGMA_g1099.t1 [Chlamydomonas eustigma]|eukprot:GAX73648.1 hypothetical protein CEUSTIGMA_g1099.t1 [Chlamydomonas eustigma]
MPRTLNYIQCRIGDCRHTFSGPRQFRYHCLTSIADPDKHFIESKNTTLRTSGKILSDAEQDAFSSSNLSTAPKSKPTIEIEQLVAAFPERGEAWVCAPCALFQIWHPLTPDFEEENKSIPSSSFAKHEGQLGASALNHLGSNWSKYIPHIQAKEAVKSNNLAPELAEQKRKRMQDAQKDLDDQALQQLREVKAALVGGLNSLSPLEQQAAATLVTMNNKGPKVQLGEQLGPSCSARQPIASGVFGAANSAYNYLMSPDVNYLADALIIDNKTLETGGHARPSSGRMEGGDSNEDNEEVQGPFQQLQQLQSKPPQPPISHTPSQGQQPSTTIIHDWRVCTSEKYMLRKLLSRLSLMGKLEPPELVTTSKFKIYANLKGDQFLESRVPKEVVFVYLLNFLHKTIATKSFSINDVDRDNARKAELSLGVTDFYQALEEVGEDLNRILKDGFEGLGAAPPFAWLKGLHVEDVHARMQTIQSEKIKFDKPKLLMDTATAAYTSGARQMQKTSDAFASKLTEIEEERKQLLEYKEKARLKVMAGLAAFYQSVDSIVRQSVTHKKGWHVGQHRDIFRGIETTGTSHDAPYQPAEVTLPCHNEIEVQDMELVQGQLQETYMKGLETVLTDHVRGFPLDEKDEKERSDLISKLSSITEADVPDRAGQGLCHSLQ